MNYDKQIAIEAFLEDIGFDYSEIEQMQADIDVIRCSRMREHALNAIEWIEDDEELEAMWQDVAEHPADYIDNQAFKNTHNLDTFFYNDNGTSQDWKLKIEQIVSDVANELNDKYREQHDDDLMLDGGWFYSYLKEQLDMYL